MKAGYKAIFLICFLIPWATVFGQCPAAVQLTSSPNNPVCRGTNVTFNAVPTAGGITSYIWIVNGDTVSTGSSMSTSVDGAHVELYAVSDTCNLDTMYTDKYILNVLMQAEYNVIIEECNQPVADIVIGTITGGQEPYTYELITTSGSLGQETTYSDVAISTYPLIITDDNGCEDTTWIDMATVICPPPSPIDAFTPNEDGYTDKWIINNIQFYPDNEVFVYDRWGQRVFHKKGYTNKEAWDAKYIGMDMPVSTYYYILKINYQKQEEQIFNGAVSIFR